MRKYEFAKWLESASIRALKTAAESAIGVIGSTAIFSQVDWKVVAGTVLLSWIMSFLFSIKGLPELDAEKLIEDIKNNKDYFD